MAIRNESFASFRQIDDGINASVDPQDITITEVADALNMVFRNGYPESRSGSKLKWSKPTGETNSLLNLIRARDSLGNNFAVAIYAPNFYVRDDANSQWIKINNNYNPSATYATYSYGYINWNAGKASDVLYAGNGQEDCIKWPIVLRHLSVAALATDNTLTVDDGSFFPSSGYVVIKAASSSEIYAQIASVSGNIITLAAPLGTAAASGAGVTCQIADASALPKGNIFTKSNGRLFIAGKPKYETVVYFSVINNPEDFTTTGHADSSGNKPITDGNGGITSMAPFGEFVLITKTDSAYRISFEIQAGVDSFLVSVFPVFADASLGPVTNAASIKKNNDLFFATLTEGLFALTPGVTGSNLSVTPSLISQGIYRIYTGLNFSNSKAVSWNQFVLWTAATSVVSDTVLVLDLLKTSAKQKYCWTRLNNWGVQDWIVYKDTNGELLYFGNRVDGNIYQAFANDYVDLETSSTQTPYTCSFTTKRCDQGSSPIPLGQAENSRAYVSAYSHPDKLKVADLLHVQGYITTTGKLYIDIMFNENGKLQTITKSISGTEALVNQVSSPALAQIQLGLPYLGGTLVQDMDTLGFINEYIPLPISVGFTNIQFRFYTVDAGIHWGITGFAYNGIMKDGIHAGLVQQS